MTGIKDKEEEVVVEESRKGLSTRRTLCGAFLGANGSGRITSLRTSP
jgi:hypothetical protein